MLKLKIRKSDIIAIAIIIIFGVSPVIAASNILVESVDKTTDIVSYGNDPDIDLSKILGDADKSFDTQLINYNSTTTSYNPNWEFIRNLKDNPNEYKKIWEPWLTKAAVHSIVVSDDMDTIAFGGGYLYDNEVHIYRWNYEKKEYEKAWDSGDSIIKGDVIALAYGDTDNNDLKEIIAGSADGYIYVFEQKHIFDPLTNMESIYELVWKSPYLGPVWSVKVADLDGDYLPEIIAGTWNNKIHMFEYYNHSNYPFRPDHWIDYREVWNSEDIIQSKVYSIETGDFNGNGLPEFLVGTRKGWIYLFENNGTVIDINGYNFPFMQDNSYKLIWFNNYSAFTPIMSTSSGDLDGDGIQEASVVAVTQSSFVLDYDKNSDEFSLTKLYYDVKSWEKSSAPIGSFPVDNWMDWSIEAVNVFYTNSTGTTLEEPIPLSDAQSELKYHNTAMAAETDGRYSKFLPNSTHNASAVLDFGAQEEAVGDGTSANDIYIVFRDVSGFNTTIDRGAIRFYLSMDGVKYVELTNYTVTTVSFGKFTLYADIDEILRNESWRFVRYMKIEVYQGNSYAIDSIYTYNIERQLTDAMSTLVTDFNFLYQSKMKVILFGTIQGNIVMFAYNKTTKKYEEIYNALDLDGFLLNTHIWYMAKTKDDTKFPYWLYGAKYDLTSQPFNIVSFDLYDLNGDGFEDMIVGTDDGRVLFLQGTTNGFIYDSSVSSAIFGGVNSYFSTFTSRDLRVKMADFSTLHQGPELIVSALSSSSSAPEIHVFTPKSFYELTYNSSRMFIVSRYELSGEYRNLFVLQEEQNFDIADIDGNGYPDIVVTGGVDGEIYLIKNLGYKITLLPPNQGGLFTWEPQYIIDKTYFAGINELKGYKKLGKVEVVDFNNDGLYDIVASYIDKKGATYFENVGTKDRPEWVEKKTLFSNSGYSTNPVTNLAFNNHTDISIWEENGKYFMYTKDWNDDIIYRFDGDTKKVTTLLLATYPLLEKINMAPISLKSNPLNYGYHVFSVWNTRDELRGWTQAVDHGDIDGDGKGEVIVGDFDNNVYIFEHLINNTYKRAFRSPDLYYEYRTNVSPYMSEELTGLGASFKLRVWEHARFVEADADIDGDGLKELIVVTGLQVFIFEHKGYENYELEYNISLLNHPLGLYARLSGGITAFAYSRDFDYDGLGEIILAVKRVLMIFELTESGTFVETFSSDVYDLSYMLMGIYDNVWISNGEFFDLPGTGILTPIEYYNISDLLDNMYKYTINDIAVGDVDDNGLKEIIIGGSSECDCKDRIDGFVYSIEVEMGTYYLKWFAPENITYRNPINTLELSDMDYDSRLELVVGGKMGIDIFEHTGTMYLEYENSITKTPNHPYAIPNRSLTEYSTAQLFNFTSYDIVALPNNKIYVFFDLDHIKLGQRIYFVYSDDGGKTWSPATALTENSTYPTNYTLQEEFNPQAVHRSIYTSYIMITWVAKVSDSSAPSGVRHGIFYAYFYYETNTLSSIGEIVSSETPNNIILNIRLYSMYTRYGSTYYYYGLSYINASDANLYNYVFYGIDLGGFFIYLWGLMSKTSSIDGVAINYLVLGFDISYIGNDQYMIVFLGYNSNMSRYILYSSVSNISLKWVNKTSVAPINRLGWYPFLSYYSSGNIIILTYSEWSSGQYYSNKLKVSRDGGLTWSDGVELERRYNGLVEVCQGDITKWMYNPNLTDPTNTTTLYDVTYYFTYMPITSISWDDSFVYGFIAKVYNSTYTSTYGSLNQLENNIAVFSKDTMEWAFFEMGEISELAIGDSDGDSRMEIVSNYYEDGFTVFEIINSIPGKKTFSQVFTVEHLNNTLFDISIGDSNNNGFNEIVVSTDYGNVYSYEFKYYNWVSTQLKVPKLENKLDLGSMINSLDAHGVIDVEGDGVKEFYFARDGDRITIVRMADGIFDDIIFTGTLLIELLEVPNSTIGDDFLVLFDNGTLILLDPLTSGAVTGTTNIINNPKGMSKQDNTLIVYNNSAIQILNLTDFSTISILPFTPLSMIVVDAVLVKVRGDIKTAGIKFSNGTIIGFDLSNGKTIWTLNTTDTASPLVMFDIDGDGTTEIYTINETSTGVYSLYIIDPLDGTVLYDVETSLKSLQGAEVTNIDGDSYPEILLWGAMGISVLTSKNYEFVWETSFLNSIKGLFVGDFNGDNLTDMIYSSQPNTALILGNQYGVTRSVVIVNDLFVYGAFTDYDGDGETEILMVSRNGTVAAYKLVDFNKTVSGTAYKRFYKHDSINVFQSNESYPYDGFIQASDVDGDGYDDLIVSNGTAIALVNGSQKSVEFINRTNSRILGIETGDYYGDSNEEIVYHNGTHYTVIDSKGQLITVKDPRYNSTDFITKLFLRDFDNDGKSELVVATRYYVSLWESNLEKSYDRTTLGIIYVTVGDYNGDGLIEIAMKFIDNKYGGTFYIFNYTLGFSILTYVNLGSTKANKYLPDILTFDYDADGKDEILFFNLTGEIDVIDTTGVIDKIYTGIKNYATWVGPDKIFGFTKGLAVKYAYDSFRIIAPNGTTILSVNDSSSTNYQIVDVNGDGFGEYLGSTEAKVFAISEQGIEYYNKLDHQTSGFAIADMGGTEFIAVLKDNGEVDYYKLATYTQNIPTEANGTHEIKTYKLSAWTASTIIVAIVLIDILALGITSRRKRYF